MNVRRPATPGAVAVLAGAAFCGLALAASMGCDSQSEVGRPRGPAQHKGAQGGLFNSVAENLNRVEQFDLNETLPQISDRLNQWYQQEKPKDSWKLDPIVETLPENLRNVPVMKRLDFMQFNIQDAWYLQESAWLRDVSRSARGDQFDDLAVAERLFDWTVRNIDLLPDDDSNVDRVPHNPFEILLFGRGTAAERAWIFMLLARQQKLDVVMLGLENPDGDVRSWLPALVAGDDLYLFDSRLGMPIPGPEGKGVATLAQVMADESLLRQLDLDVEHPYPVKADELKHVVALVEASPHALSRRMALVEARLSGRSKLALSSPGGALVERLKKLPGVSDARLWTSPFEIYLRRSKMNDAQAAIAAREMFVFQVAPSLLTGRALYFKGSYEGPHGAKRHLLNARPSKSDIDNFRITGEMAQRVPKEARPQVEALQSLTMQQGKDDATYWLGLIFITQEDCPTAIQYLDQMTLRANPKGRWTAGARYNLGRCYEAEGEMDKAVALYEADPTSPQAHGNQLRARRLKQAKAKDAPDSKSDAAKPAE